MKPIEQLQEILCEVESVEKDVKELRFGCEFSALWAKQRFTELDQWCIYINKWWELVYDTDEYWEVHCKILWNPLSLKHLMMYCNEKGINLITQWEWIFSLEKWQKLTPKSKLEIVTKYDITKPLYQQSDEVLEKIFNFLKG